MIEALHAILTNSKIRSVQQVEVVLAENKSAGTPWFGKNIAKAN